MLDNRRVLALCPRSHIREALRRTLAEANFQVNFVSSTTDLHASLVDYHPGVVVHDWAAADPSQSREFQLRIARQDSSSHIMRVIIIEEITPGILALANDAAVRLVLSYANAALNLGPTLDRVDNTPVPELHKRMWEIRSGDREYKQEEVDELIEKSYKEYPHDEQVQMEYGSLTYRQNNLSVTERICNELLRRNPQNVRAMNLYSRILMKRGEFDNASRVLQQADNLSPSNPERLVMLGDAFYGAGDLDKAMEAYQEAHTLDPENQEATKGVCRVKLDVGEVREAIELLRNSLSEDEAAGFFNNSAVQVIRAGNVDEGLRLYRIALKALRTKRYRPTILSNMALAFRRNGNDREALRHLQQALRINPNHEAALRQISQLQKKVS